jgi:hypothetical protein
VLGIVIQPSAHSTGWCSPGDDVAVQIPVHEGESSHNTGTADCYAMQNTRLDSDDGSVAHEDIAYGASTASDSASRSHRSMGQDHSPRVERGVGRHLGGCMNYRGYYCLSKSLADVLGQSSLE